MRLPIYLYLGIIVFSVAGATGQQTPPTSPPAPAPQQGSPDQSLMETDSSIYTLQSTVHEINLDIVATDSKGKPVRGLTRNDFRVLDQGKPQVLRGFNEHDLSAAATEPPLKLPPNTFTNYVPAGNRNASFVILFDSLDSPVDGQQKAFVAANNFLKDLAPGTSVAIFGLHDRMNLVQGFTTDRAVLLNALKDGRVQPKSSPLLGTGNEVMRQQVLNEGMLMMGRYLSGFPGRKNLIWFVVNIPGSFNSRTATIQGGAPTGSLNGSDVAASPELTASQTAVQGILRTNTSEQQSPSTVGSQSAAQDAYQSPSGLANPNAQANVDRETSGSPNGNPFQALTNLIDDSKSTRDALTLSRVVVYTVDPRQLMTPTELGANPGYLIEQGAMKEVAAATGGEAFVNRNDIQSIMQEIVAKGSDYYTLTYSPANIQWNGSFRKLKVETIGGASQRTALHLDYRPGYYAADRVIAGRPLASGFTTTTTQGDQFLLASELKGDVRTTSDPLALPREGLQASMTIGQIPPTELILNASLKPTVNALKLAKGDAVPEGNYLRDKFKHQPFRMYDVLFATDASGLQLPQSPDGLHHGGVEFVAAVYTDEGDVVNSFKVTIALNLKDTSYRGLLRNGIGTKHSLAIPVKGKYVVRLGVHDLNSDRVGALEFPLTAVTAGVAGAGQETLP